MLFRSVLTLVFTPSLLAVRVWIETYVMWIGRLLVRLGASRHGKAAKDWSLRRQARRTKTTEIIWDEDHLNPAKPVIMPLPDAAE